MSLYDADDIFSIMDSEVKVRNIFQKCMFLAKAYWSPVCHQRWLSLNCVVLYYKLKWWCYW